MRPGCCHATKNDAFSLLPDWIATPWNMTFPKPIKHQTSGCLPITTGKKQKMYIFEAGFFKKSPNHQKCCGFG